MEREKVATLILARLGEYARVDRPIAFKGEPGTKQILADNSRLPMQIGDKVYHLIDRRIVGSNWLDVPSGLAEGPPRIVFGSLKGGVGRSTALAVLSSDLARRNKNVLVLDLDLEAPGIGDLLLAEERMPLFGVADFLVENGIGGIPESRLDDFIGVSALTMSGGGTVKVVPAFGRLAQLSPENVLAKLSRALIEDINQTGDSTSVSVQISEMINRIVAHTPCDIVLIDSRAGLSEITAPSIVGLGAMVLLFGNSQIQTINGYRGLLAGLGLLAKRDRALGKDADWRLRLKAVHAKASLDEVKLAKHRDNLYELFAESLYDEDRGISELSDISFDINDDQAPHSPLLVPFNQSFLDFDPVQTPGQLSQVFYETAFRPFLDGIDRLIESNINNPLVGALEK
jgi:MinD-like ATPase involved in chromosome partitioning or flagellar assembly